MMNILNNLLNYTSADQPCDAHKRGPGLGRMIQEPTLWIALLLTLAIHGTFIGASGLRGEESRRGLVAVEMLRTGDWIVPRQQGTVFISRPPLQNWIIAAYGEMLGKVDRLAVRLPSLCALLMTVILLYTYSRRWLSMGGATLAAIAYPTMGQVLELGSLGETESMYTLIVAGSILLWHWGWTARWPAALTWSIGYSLAAGGMLAKGYQAPVYFVAVAAVYLVVTRQWRSLFTTAHAIGLAVFFLLWNAWNVPYMMAVGLENTIKMYHQDVALRFEDPTWSSTASHLMLYPLQVLACMLPWSLLLPIMLMPSFWRSLKSRRDVAVLMTTAILVTFPSVWFAPGAHERYFMPLYPLFAVLFAIGVEQAIEAARAAVTAGGQAPKPLSIAGLFTASWQRYQYGFSVAVALAGCFVCYATLAENLPSLASSRFFGLALGGTLVAIAAVLWRLASDPGSVRLARTAIASGIALGLLYCGLVAPMSLADTNDVRPAIATLKRSMPDGQPLVSIGLVDHLFALQYGETIEPVDMQTVHPTASNPQRYICFNSHVEIELPPEIKMEVIETVNCNRSLQSRQTRQVIVARCYLDMSNATDTSTIAQRTPLSSTTEQF